MPSKPIDGSLLEELLAAAEQVAARAYAPYSRAHVGAALLGEDGVTYLGCNVENASYGLTICAERTAATRAVADGVRRFQAGAVWVSSNQLFTPCGACRQFLFEFAPEMPLLIGCAGGKRLATSLEELLPAAFRFPREDA